MAVRRKRTGAPVKDSSLADAAGCLHLPNKALHGLPPAEDDLSDRDAVVRGPHEGER